MARGRRRRRGHFGPCALQPFAVLICYKRLMNAARAQVVAELTACGYAQLGPQAARAALELDLAGLAGLRDSWERLPRDTYLRDGGKYRARRHSFPWLKRSIRFRTRSSSPFRSMSVPNPAIPA